jgi:hypothetical protein
MAFFFPSHLKKMQATDRTQENPQKKGKCRGTAEGVTLPRVGNFWREREIYKGGG